MNLPNETKIRFCNAFAEMNRHHPNCTACAEYLAFGNGDLCDRGKAIIGKNLAYADTDRVELATSDYPSQAHKKAFMEGWEASDQAYPRTANPYIIRTALHEWWDAGWSRSLDELCGN